ncbi:glycosyl hydrolase family 28-related protein [Lamprocystis purpurea]|uniref:glycosyl hydrolase family 28-related protein n=1 Tax=Lamprocystis purpurea TaxID=61598 RepID=UPI0009FE1B2D|nr:glycosyl hydrolase family 28-related protein [Lamprocystis purpurea]
MQRFPKTQPWCWVAFLALVVYAGVGFGAGEALDPDDPLVQRGLVSVSAFGATANDDTDDTAAILKALATARDRGMVTYFASGTYLVSDTLTCFQRATHNGRRHVLERRKPCAMVGAGNGERSVLRLIPGAPGFNDPERPKPLVWFWAQPDRGARAASVDPLDGDPGISFNQVIKGIDIDLRAAGNAGAVGIRHAGSQGSTIEDISIFADGAFSGLYDTPGQGGGVYDLRVYGGRYGVYATAASRYPLLVGCRFLRQDTAAIDWSGNVVFVMVGFLIENASSRPVLTLRERGPVFSRGFVLVDGVIESAGPLAVDNTAGKALTLTNVYFKTNGASVKSAYKPPVPTAGLWTRILEYSYTGTGYLSMINGETHSAGYEVIQAAASAPPATDALIRRHLWEVGFPSFDDPEVVDVRRFGAIPDDLIDDTDAIQKALDKNAKVLLPKGVFLLNRPLVLGPSNALLGIGKTISVLRESTRWVAGSGKALVTTVADANARPSLSFVLLETLSTARAAVDWRAGSASSVRDIMAGPIASYYGEKISNPGHTFRISGTGGGRWYAIAAEWGHLHGATYDPNYSHLLVEGTSQALAFYGLNIERDAVWPQAIIRDSANIDLFYLKVEADEWRGATPPGVLLIERSRNIRIFGMTGNAHPPGASLVTLDGSDDVMLTQVAGFRPKDDFFNVVELRSGSSLKIGGNTPLALFKRERGTLTRP